MPSPSQSLQTLEKELYNGVKGEVFLSAKLENVESQASHQKSGDRLHYRHLPQTPCTYTCSYLLHFISIKEGKEKTPDALSFGLV